MKGHNAMLKSALEGRDNWSVEVEVVLSALIGQAESAVEISTRDGNFETYGLARVLIRYNVQPSPTQHQLENQQLENQLKFLVCHSQTQRTPRKVLTQQ